MDFNFTPISKRNQKRYDSFFNAKGEPKKIRVYDNSDTAIESIDCYTIVLTGSYRKQTGAFLSIGCSPKPFHPCGVGYISESNDQIDTPKYSHLGKKIGFDRLSKDAQSYVLNTYKSLWKFTNDDNEII